MECVIHLCLICEATVDILLTKLTTAYYWVEITVMLDDFEKLVVFHSIYRLL